MKLSEARTHIEKLRVSGLINSAEALRLIELCSRTGDYGNKWSYKRQCQMRATVLGV